MSAPGSGIVIARQHTVVVDEIVTRLLPRLPPGAVTAVALGRYGRRELTPGSTADLLILHGGQLSHREVVDLVLPSFWERRIALHLTEWTPATAASSAGSELPTVTRLLDARLIAGDTALFAELRDVSAPSRRDSGWLRRQLGDEVYGRHAVHASVASATTPDLERGRGGLRDLEIVRWLDDADDPRLDDALDFLLRLRAAVENLLGNLPERLSLASQDRVAPALGYPPTAAGGDALMAELYGHARWVAFCLDGALAPARRDRRLRLGLAIHGGRLVGERLPPIEWAPTLGLRVANLVSFAPPSRELLRWASAPGPPLPWERAMLDQLVRLLQVADWRAWEFLEVTGLLLRYLPEWASHHRRRHRGAPHDLAADHRGFQVLRQLHHSSETGGDWAVDQAWRGVGHRGWLDVAALFCQGEQEPSAGAPLVKQVCERLGLPSQAGTTITFLVEQHHLLSDIARSRDIYDEELISATAALVGSRQRLDMLYLLTRANTLVTDERTPTTWETELIGALYQLLAHTLEQPARPRRRYRRSLEYRRRQVVEELRRQGRDDLLLAVGRLPPRYLLARSPASVVLQLALASGEALAEGEVRIRADRHHQHPDIWEILLVARDRPGLLATMAGVLTLRGVSVLAADVATCSDGLVLDVFAVTSAHGVPLEETLWPSIATDLSAALDGRLPLDDLLAHGAPAGGESDQLPTVRVDNGASRFYTVIEVRAPDQVGVLYRIARALTLLGVDIHYAKIATSRAGVLDAFYVWDLAGAKLDEPAALSLARDLTALLATPAQLGGPAERAGHPLPQGIQATRRHADA